MREDNKEYLREYYSKNKEKYNAYHKKYYENNKEKVKEIVRLWRKKKKDLKNDENK
jgi:hypothetical protein